MALNRDEIIALIGHCDRVGMISGLERKAKQLDRQHRHLRSRVSRMPGGIDKDLTALRHDDASSELGETGRILFFLRNGFYADGSTAELRALCDELDSRLRQRERPA